MLQSIISNAGQIRRSKLHAYITQVLVEAEIILQGSANFAQNDN